MSIFCDLCGQQHGECYDCQSPRARRERQRRKERQEIKCSGCIDLQAKIERLQTQLQRGVAFAKERVQLVEENKRLQGELVEVKDAVELLDKLRQSLIRDKEKLMARCKAAEAKGE